MTFSRELLGLVCFSVDVNWYRGPQPSGMSGQMPVGGSAAKASNNLYGDGAHAGGDTDNQAGSAAAYFAQAGIVPAPDITDNQGSTLARVIGVGSPIGVVTPTAIGEQYEEQHTGSIWIANGLTSSSWTQVRNNP